MMFFVFVFVVVLFVVVCFVVVIVCLCDVDDDDDDDDDSTTASRVSRALFVEVVCVIGEDVMMCVFVFCGDVMMLMLCGGVCDVLGLLSV